MPIRIPEISCCSKAVCWACWIAARWGASGNLTIKHEIRYLELSVNRLSTGLLIAALFTGSSLLLSTGFPPVLAGVSVFGALGNLAAVVLGVRFLWRIRTVHG